MKIILNSLVPVFLLIILVTLNNCKKEEKSLPVLITVPVRSVTATTALMGGQIAYDGGAEITERGVCWGTEPNPDKSGSKKNGGKGTGSYKCTLTGLNPGTLYYARAYATNSEGTAYGGEVKFTTGKAEAPTVVTIVDPIRIYYYDAVMGAYIEYDGGAPVTEKGICWGTGENPTIIDNDKSINNKPIDTIGKNYWCTIYPLKPNSAYHARAYAINAIDTSYGDDKSITTLSEPEVATLPANEITNNSASVGGNVTSIINAFNIEIGICYGTEVNPTVNGLHVQAEIIEPGDFTCRMTGLTSGTMYYVRTYVHWIHYINESFLEYTVYGNEVTFTTK
jgi:hypothetical protein